MTDSSQTCRGSQCTIQRLLPFAGPIFALGLMFVIMAIVIVPAMIG